MNPDGFHFIRPLWLCLIPIVGLLWWQLRQVRDPLEAWRNLMDPELLSAQVVGDSKKYHQFYLVLFWILTSLALAGPTWQPEPSPFADEPSPVMLVMRAEASMTAPDLAPSRLERAQLKLRDYAQLSAPQPLGLVAYAGTAHLVLPPTRDSSIVADMASELSPDVMPKSGDDLAGALALASEYLPDGGSLVVVADRVERTQLTRLRDFASDNRLELLMFGFSAPGSPDWTSLEQAAEALDTELIATTADNQDIEQIEKVTRSATVLTESQSGDLSEIRWQEAGWFLVPLLMLLYLPVFRRVKREGA